MTICSSGRLKSISSPQCVNSSCPPALCAAQHEQVDSNSGLVKVQWRRYTVSRVHWGLYAQICRDSTKCEHEILMPHTCQLERVVMETVKWHTHTHARTQDRSFRLFSPLSQSNFLLCWRSYFYRLLYKMRLLFSIQCVIFSPLYPILSCTMGAECIASSETCNPT